MGKSFEKQIKTTEDQGKNQSWCFRKVKTKRTNKTIEGKSNNQSKAAIIFSDLISKRKKIMSELYDRVDYNNLNFEYVGPTESVSFHGYMNSKELFNAIKNNQIKFSEVKNKQNEFLNKLSNIKIGKKNSRTKRSN